MICHFCHTVIEECVHYIRGIAEPALLRVSHERRSVRFVPGSRGDFGVSVRTIRRTRRS